MSIQTRKEYMNESREASSEKRAEIHHRYYAQFVTGLTLNRIRNMVGLDDIKASRDPHMNDIPIRKFEQAMRCNGQGGRAYLFGPAPMDYEAVRTAGESDTISTRVCVAKAAARILITEDY